MALFDLLHEEKRTEILTVRKAYLTDRLKELYKLEKAGKPKSFNRVVLERVKALACDELQWISILERSPKRRERHANG